MGLLQDVNAGISTAGKGILRIIFASTTQPIQAGQVVTSAGPGAPTLASPPLTTNVVALPGSAERHREHVILYVQIFPGPPHPSAPQDSWDFREAYLRLALLSARYLAFMSNCDVGIAQDAGMESAWDWPTILDFLDEYYSEDDCPVNVKIFRPSPIPRESVQRRPSRRRSEGSTSGTSRSD